MNASIFALAPLTVTEFISASMEGSQDCNNATKYNILIWQAPFQTESPRGCQVIATNFLTFFPSIFPIKSLFGTEDVILLSQNQWVGCNVIATFIQQQCRIITTIANLSNQA